MSFLLLGISHRTAPIEERERLALPAAALPDALRLLGTRPGVREGLIVSTCNRVEVVVDAEGPITAADLLQFLSLATQQAQAPASHLFYELQGEGVARHLFRVASSLDSVIVGEPQILGQIKDAFAAAQAAELIGPELDGLLSRAFHTAKRVRTETGIATHPVSASQAAVDLARQIFGDLRQKAILLLGAGEMGESAARYLMQQGASRLMITNRSFERAAMLAQKYHGEAFPLERLQELGENADVVISCTGSPRPLLLRADVAHFLSRRRGRPMLFLDVAVPRDVDPAVHQLENAFVYNVDDLDKVVSSNLAERRQEALAAEAIVEAEVATYWQRRQARELVPALRALQDHAEAVRLAEWERMRGRLSSFNPEQLEQVEALTRSLMKKWLHPAMVELKSAPTAADRAAMAEAALRLFALHHDE